MLGRARYLWFLAASLVLVACKGGSVGTEPISRCYPPGACDPSMFETGVAAERGDPERGADLFSASCTSCHDKNGHGKGVAAGVDFTSAVWQAGYSDAQLAAFVKRGSPPRMPAFALPDGQLRDLVAFIRTLELKKEGEPGY